MAERNAITVRDADLGVTLRVRRPSREERQVARIIAQACWFRDYRDLSVIKRLACVNAARALLETLEGGE